MTRGLEISSREFFLAQTPPLAYNRLMSWLILLPAFAYIFLTLALAKDSLARAFLQAHLIVFAFIAVSAEVLSFFRALQFLPVLAAWVLFLLFCGRLLVQRIRSSGLILPAIRFSSPFDAVLTTGVSILLGAALASALLYPPNSWDGLTYHLARVVHWIQNGSVAFYPTSVTRQLYQMPLAEYAILHLQLLAGGDFFAALIQWVSFVLLILLASLAAEELGLNPRGRWISAAVMASLPIGVIQASGAQNDLVVAGFLCAFAYYLLRILKKSPHGTAEDVFFAALAFGLALLTKGTAYLFSAGIGVSLGLAILFGAFTLTSSSDLPTRNKAFCQSAVLLAAIVLFGLSLNLPHLWRNYRLYGNPLSTESEEYANQNHSLRALTGNLIRNAALHLATPWETVNRAEYRLLARLLGAELDNPQTTWNYAKFAVVHEREETKAGNLPHMLGLLAGLILIPLHAIQTRDFKLIAYAGGIFLGWWIYCWMLNWQPWAARLHTPLFALSAPLIALALGKFGKRAEGFLAVAFLLYAMPYAFQNENRPLLSMEWRNAPRESLYFFRSQPESYPQYQAAAQALEGYRGEVGLLVGEDFPEYALWALTGQTVPKREGIAFRHVGVKNPSGKIEPDGQPEYLIVAAGIERERLTRAYVLIFQSERVSVFKKRK